MVELWNPPTNAIHIDPTNTGDTQTDGSLEHPFTRFDDIDWQDNIIVVLKRGTIHKSKPNMDVWKNRKLLKHYMA